jgi:hypothetical protein
MESKDWLAELCHWRCRPRAGRSHPSVQSFGWRRWLHSNSARRDRRGSVTGRLGIRYPTARLERWMDRRHHHGSTRILFIGLRAFWMKIFRGAYGCPRGRTKAGPAFQNSEAGPSR